MLLMWRPSPWPNTRSSVFGHAVVGMPYGVVYVTVTSQPPLPAHRLVALPFTLMLLMWRPSPWPNTRSSGFAVFCHWAKRILGESLTCTPLLAETDAMVTHLAL